jgi:predicted TIM-barrel fold metal-dependent hydrolase
MAEHPVVDADGHILEGPAWLGYLPSQLAERALEMELSESGARLVVGGRAIDVDFSPGDGATPGGLRAGNARGRGFEDVHPGAFESGPRLALMDEMGIDVTVLYPTLLLMAATFDDDLRFPMLDAYARWMVDFCAADTTRLRWAAPVPRTDIEEAVRCVELAAELGATAVFTSGAPARDGRLLGDPAEDAIYSAIVDAGLPFALHVSDSWNSTIDTRRLTPNRFMWDVAAGPMEMMYDVLWVFASGLLERFPTLRIAFLEGNVGWFAYWLHKMEESHEHFGSMFPMPAQTPLEQFRERCWISGDVGEPELPDVARLLGPDRCLFSSDFPHYEASWQPVDELRRRPDLAVADQRAILLEGALGFYGRGLVAGV